MSNMKPFKELEFKDSFMFAAIMMDVEKASVVEEHPQDILLKKIQERIKTLKESRRWEKFYMLIGGWGQGLYYEGHEAGRWEKLKELVNRKVQKGCSAEEIADMLEEPLENIQKILRELEP